MLVTLAVVGFIGSVGRDKYRVARDDGMRRIRSVVRAIRRSIDMFILGNWRRKPLANAI